MILSFTTQLNGKPTFFVEKILIGINKHIGTYSTGLFLKTFQKRFESKPPVNYNSKIHSIRKDEKNRWRPGMKIHFYINARQNNMFWFAPVLPVVSIQKINIEYLPSLNNKICKVVWIDDNIFYDEGFNFNQKGMLEFVNNDGFDTIEDFFDYFKEDFTGILIHWTDLKY